MPIALSVHGLLESGRTTTQAVSGYGLHGAFFQAVQRADPMLAELLHRQDEKPFTLAPLPIRSSSKNSREASPYAFRISLLQDEIYPVLSRSFLQGTPEIILENRKFLVSEIRAASGSWVAHATYKEILEKSQPAAKIGLQFITSTVFKRGDLDYPLPDPRLALSRLAQEMESLQLSCFSTGASRPDTTDRRLLPPAIAYSALLRWS